MDVYEYTQAELPTVEIGGTAVTLNDVATVLELSNSHYQPSSLAEHSDCEGPTTHHEWRLDDAQDLPCGCETVAMAALADLPGTHDAIIVRTGSSVRCTLYYASCVRCNELLVVVQNGSNRRRWIAQSFMQSASGAWVEVDMPPQVVCDLGIDPWSVRIARPTGICSAAQQDEHL